MSNWIRWHRDGRGFTHTVTITSKGVIVANYRVTRRGNIRRELVLVPKKLTLNQNGRRVLFEEYYDEVKIKSLITALSDLASIALGREDCEHIVGELEKIIIHLDYLKNLLKEAFSNE